ncbi:MAG: hypothetical protein KAI66_28020, partial [Lentisphaeria bacterium]|nr:hypothetical protein [Lentisphaeria bacterium]
MKPVLAWILLCCALASGATHDMRDWGLTPDSDSAAAINAKLRSLRTTETHTIIVDETYAIGSSVDFLDLDNLTI